MEEKAPWHYNDMKIINTSKLNKPDKNIKISTTGNYSWKLRWYKEACLALSTEPYGLAINTS